MRTIVLLLVLTAAMWGQARKLMVLSVDGLDHRYLRDADKMGLKIPNIRRLMREGEWADGVVGVAPTVTWPSHTSMITGVRPEEHGILGNRKPREQGGEYYWSVSNLKAPTLWQKAKAAGKTVGAVTWPVTVDAPIDYLIPEYFKRRNGGFMDIDALEEKSTPGLLAEIAKRYPAFPHEWIDDRSRTLAAMSMIQDHQPDLLLVHFVDLDSEEHERAPFTRDAKGILEYTDQLIGDILRILPKDYVFALVSDHGFERVSRIVNVPVLLNEASVTGPVMSFGGVLTTPDEKVAEFLRSRISDPKFAILREIPKAEVERFSRRLATMAAVFEPAPEVMFGPATKGDVETKPQEIGNHGFWPLRKDYRSIFLLSGPGVKARKVKEMDMLDICGRLQGVLKVD